MSDEDTTWLYIYIYIHDLQGSYCTHESNIFNTLTVDT